MRRFFRPSAEKCDETQQVLPAPKKARKSQQADITEAEIPATATTLGALMDNLEPSHDGDGSLPLATITFARDQTILSPDDLIFAQNAPVGSWFTYKGLMCKFTTTQGSEFSKIIAFDLDSTLIEPASGAKFSKNATDWRFIYSNIPTTLRRLSDEGYALVIFSNQKGLEDGNRTVITSFQAKVDAVLTAIDRPIDILSAITDDIFRKPLPGMWEFFIFARCTNLSPLHAMYIGDAAGRPKDAARKKDHSDGDLTMAINAGLTFRTPEVFFMRSTARIHNFFRPRSDRRLFELVSDSAVTENDVNHLIIGVSPIPEIILLVAPPGCGKSTHARYAELTSNGHIVRVNSDEMKGIEKCKTAAKHALSAGHAVLVDNTNVDPITRNVWIAFAREQGVPIRAVVLQVSKEHAFLLLKYRCVSPATPIADKRKIPSMVIHSMYKKMIMPVVGDGFARVDVVQVPRLKMPEDFASRRLFHMYLSS